MTSMLVLLIPDRTKTKQVSVHGMPDVCMQVCLACVACLPPLVCPQGLAWSVLLRRAKGGELH